MGPPTHRGNTINGHIMLVGTGAAGLKDIRAIPLSACEPGLAIHAPALEQDHAQQAEHWALALDKTGQAFVERRSIATQAFGQGPDDPGQAVGNDCEHLRGPRLPAKHCPCGEFFPRKNRPPQATCNEWSG